ncbi:hypothetical protein T4C_1820 [Trichinella pseudospiralis]|uniref:Uncharacterized protein n=1 Tax=Trichinella pseudospiralis TaxID=6337 RepID=A0A0V1GQM2_TRIPS|nr:hypothetical protein T4C_1820 [Trichinella pseudospiralis]
MALKNASTAEEICKKNTNKNVWEEGSRPDNMCAYLLQNNGTKLHCGKVQKFS